MFDITDFEARRRVRGTLILTGFLTALIILTIGLFPSIQEAGIDLDAYLESLPPEARRAFLGNVTTISTIEGYLVSQLYQTGWLLMLGVYFAYAASSTVVKEVESGTIDLLLASPLTRTRIVVGKFLALVPSAVGVNILTLLVVDAGVSFVGEDLDFVRLLMLHTLSVPYLLSCAGLGLVASVIFDETRRAQTAGIGAVFAMFLVDTLTFDTDYEWLGDVAFSRYYDPGEILIDGDIDWAGLAILLTAIVVLLVLSAELFERKDLT